MHTPLIFRCLRIALLASAVVLANGLQAQEPANGRPLASGLDLAPASTVVYISSMNHDRVVDSFWNSRAMEQLRESPAGSKMRRAWRKGRSSGFEQFGDNPFSAWLGFYQETFGSGPFTLAWPYLDEVLKKELFFLADENTMAWLDLADSIYMEALQDAANAEAGEDPGEALLHRLPALIHDKTAGLESPLMILGCVLDDPATWRDLLTTADGLLQQGLREVPPEMEFIAQSYQFEVSDNRLSMSFFLDGDRIPWDLLYSGGGDPTEEQAMQFMEDIAAGRKLAVSVVIEDHLMMLAVSPDRQSLADLKHGPKLIDLPQLAPIREARANQRNLVWTSWISRRSGSPGSEIPQSLGMIPAVVNVLLQEEAAGHPLNERLLADLKTDIGQLERDVALLVPAVGDQVSLAWLSDDGIDGLSMVYSEDPFLDSSRPLEVLRQVGPNPALVLAARTKGQQEQFQTAGKWMDRLFYYGEVYLPEYADQGADRETLRKALAGSREIWQILRDATSRNLLPAVEGCDNAIVVDFTSRRRSWHPEMPELGVEVPVPALATVVSFSDRDAILEAGRQYWLATEKAFALITSLASEGDGLPEEIERLDQWIDVRSTEIDGKTVFDWRFMLPGIELGDWLRPQIVVGEKTLVASTLDEQNRRLSGTAGPLFGPAGDGTPAGAVFFLDFNQVVDATRAWVNYGLEAGRAEGRSLEIRNEAESDMLDFTEAELTESADAAERFLKCFHGISTSASSSNGTSTVRFRLSFSDLPAGPANR